MLDDQPDDDKPDDDKPDDDKPDSDGLGRLSLPTAAF
jgi:hypothetical protein